MAKSASVLLVEDEKTLGHGLEFNLLAEGYSVSWVKDGRDALEHLAENKYDLIILDIMLPYVDGFDIARQVRSADQQQPILFLTARSGIKDRLKGLEIGADDYMTKPFHLEELLLKVQGMLRRKKWYKESSGKMPSYNLGKYKIDFENLSCKGSKDIISLTLHEAMLLRYFIDNKGKVISRKDLLANVWNVNSDIETRTVDNFIVRLRKYFEEDPDNPVFFKSVRGVGYVFND